MSARLMNRTERLAVIERMIVQSADGLRAVEIAEACGVDRRTIYRDLTLLAEIGIPIRQQDGRFEIDRSQYRASIRLGLNEAISLHLAARVVLRSGEYPQPRLAEAMIKLEASLPPSVGLVNREPTDTDKFSTDDLRYAAILETVTRGWAEQQKVKLWYTSRADAKPRPREFSPYLVELLSNGGTFAVGFDGLSQRIRVAKLHQVARARLLNVSFQVPQHFDKKRYQTTVGDAAPVDNNSKHVVLLFSAEAQAKARQQLTAVGVEVELLPDRRLRAVLPVEWRELVPWVRAWGSQVEVVEPAGLREQIAEDAQRTARLYEMSAQV